MKKTIISFFALAILLVAGSAMAKEDKAPKAVDIKIHKKQLISQEERKALDETAKGKPANNASGSKVFQPLATGELGQPLPDGGQRYAIVVGLANYDGVANDLCVTAAKTYDQFPEGNTDLSAYCQDADSLHMKSALIDKYGYVDGNITLLRDGSATRANIRSAMENLKSKVGSNDEIVFFFSGHGTSGRLTSLTDNEALDEAVFTYDNNYIWDDEFKIWADSLGVNREIFIFDICLAGGMNDIAGNNRVLAMSSGEKQNSWTYYLGGTSADGITQMSEGLFSRYFVVNGIINGLADKSNLLSKEDYKVAIEEAFSYSYPIVKAKQTPTMSDKFSNDLLLGY